jgi:hypothetical protein
MKLVSFPKVVPVAVLLIISATVAGWAYTRSLAPPSFPVFPMETQTTTVKAGSQRSIYAPTYADAVRAFLSRQYSGQDLSHVTITNIQSVNHTSVAQVLFYYKHHLVVGGVAAVQQGTGWVFQSLQGLGWVNSRMPMNVIPMGGQITPTSTSYQFISGYVNRPDIQYVVLHFPSGPTIRIAVALSHTFSYLSGQQGPDSIDAFSGSGHLVYRWG